ncbi:MAG: sugar ABC transporter permease [Chloroflexi bacterium]|nr:sugar ABC transporter permease [Chloroflexota bacterium]
MQTAVPRTRRLGPRVRTDVLLVAVLFLLPTFAGLAIFQWLPLGVAVRNSLLRFSPLNPSAAQFVGLDNYLLLATNERFIHATINTLIYIGGKLVVQIPLGLALALLLNRSLPGTKIVRGAVFAALVASEAVIALIWNILYNPDNGLFNVLLGQVGLPAQPFLISTTQALPAILAMIVWKDIGFTLLILLAGLQTIPSEYHEAAAIDGASAWARLWHITIPLLKRMLLLATFMATIAGSRIFIPIALMTEGGPQDSTVNLVYLMYEQAFKYQRMGDASATAILIILLLIAITLVQAGLLRTDHEY